MNLLPKTKEDYRFILGLSILYFILFYPIFSAVTLSTDGYSMSPFDGNYSFNGMPFIELLKSPESQHYIGDGRFIMGFILSLIKLITNNSGVSVSLFLCTLLIIQISYFIWGVFKLFKIPINTIMSFCGGVIISLFPYALDIFYFTFASNIFAMGFVLPCMLWALYFLQNDTSKYNLLKAIGLLTYISAFYQPLFFIVFMLLMFYGLADQNDKSNTIKNYIKWIVIFVISIGLYFIINKIVLRVLDIEPAARFGLTHNWKERIDQIIYSITCGVSFFFYYLSYSISVFVCSQLLGIVLFIQHLHKQNKVSKQGYLKYYLFIPVTIIIGAFMCIIFQWYNTMAGNVITYFIQYLFIFLMNIGLYLWLIYMYNIKIKTNTVLISWGVFLVCMLTPVSVHLIIKDWYIAPRNLFPIIYFLVVFLLVVYYRITHHVILKKIFATVFISLAIGITLLFSSIIHEIQKHQTRDLLRVNRLIQKIDHQVNDYTNKKLVFIRRPNQWIEYDLNNRTPIAAYTSSAFLPEWSQISIIHYVSGNLLFKSPITTEDRQKAQHIYDSLGWQKLIDSTRKNDLVFVKDSLIIVGL